MDSLDEPWSVHLEARVEGRLEDVRLRDAVLVALDRHPRLWARLVSTGRGRHRHEWEIPPAPDVDCFDAVECADDVALAGARAQLENEPVPLTSSPPLRIRLAHSPAGDVIILNLHHVAGDGLSALALLRSIAHAYAGRDDPESDGGPEQVGIVAGGRGFGPALLELGRAARRAVHLVPDGGDDRAGYGYRHVSLSPADTARLVRWTKHAHVTVNDVLLVALHLAVERWNTEHGEPGGRVSVLMPMNLRPKSQAGHVVGNFSLMVPIPTGAADRAAPAATLAAVARRTSRIKQSRAPAAVVRLLLLLQNLPEPAKRAAAAFVAAPRRAPTTLLSNLGRVDDRIDFGPHGGTATELWFTPPVKMPVGLSVGALTAYGRLHLGFRYRHPLLGDVQMAQLARHYVQSLEALGATASGGTGRWEQAA